MLSPDPDVRRTPSVQPGGRRHARWSRRSSPKWLVERTAEIGHPILNAGRRAIDEPPLDDAVAFQSSQALGQRLLRETVHLTANGIEAKYSAGSADRAEYEDAPSIGDLIEQQAIECMLSCF